MSPADRTSARRRRWVNLALLLVVVALFAVPLGLRLGASGAAEGQAYAGTDSSATDAVAQIDPDYKPWFSPWFQPSSGEVESGLFAVQAALGAGAFGFVLGRLSGRRHAGDGTTGASPGTASPETASPSGNAATRASAA